MHGRALRPSARKRAGPRLGCRLATHAFFGRCVRMVSLRALPAPALRSCDSWPSAQPQADRASCACASCPPACVLAAHARVVASSACACASCPPACVLA
eukprot:354396-Chlamydomonas_euryale.AAC.6